MITLATFVLAAIPYCEGSVDVQGCAAWMVNDMALEQSINPDSTLDELLEVAVERLPDSFWPR